ncbi:hypothetical protein OSB04_030388 [Centaurea solstitialis]|uniref:Reverse transcriptase Ty1/copia-type domain-containing protein n=1 Tax=Centaurea solstitialis TaxID=347529 RepID=A0AA38SK53_9ASTR|nr:hypothetical protein OSB04_030388 [Centaurea solstitialis]
MAGGQYVTRLARHYGVLTDDAIASMTSLGEMGLIDMEQLRGMGAAAVDHLVGGDQFTWIPYPQTHEPRRRTRSTQETGEASGANEDEQPTDEAGHSGYEDLSNRLSEMQLTYGRHHQHMEYNTTEALHQANWQSGLMNRMASQFGVAPATPFAASQFWPFSDDAPPGYPTFEDWREIVRKLEKYKTGRFSDREVKVLAPPRLIFEKVPAFYQLSAAKMKFSTAKLAFALTRRFQNLPKIYRVGFLSVSRRERLLGERETASGPSFKYCSQPSVPYAFLDRKIHGRYDTWTFLRYIAIDQLIFTASDVFAPVARIEAIRLFLAFASYKGFKVYQMDVKSAFLYGTIDEEVYVSQPPGFEDPKYPDKVYKLRKALYGLHQAPRAWYDTLSSYLLENKFERGVIDKTLFIKRTKSDMLLVQIYVDDIIFGSTKDDMCKEFEELMHKKFKMSSMGELTFFLGLQVKQKPEGIFINQSKYVASMLQKFGMNDAKPASTAMETHKHLTADVEGEEVDVHHYRSMIGSLMYLTASRPDIMFAVCVCARYQVRPKESHLHAVKRIFKYLKGQPTLGLWYPNDSSFDLVAYTDSDYGGANLDRKSTSGGCQFLGGRLVSWQCKKQTTVSQSTTEAEYIAASQCCSQVLWIQNQMQDYGLSFLQTPIYIDNNSAISIVNNPVKHSKTKHIEIKYHFIRDCNEKKLIQVLKVHTNDQYADLFTKAFDVGRFTFLVTSVGMMNSE